MSVITLPHTGCIQLYTARSVYIIHEISIICGVHTGIAIAQLVEHSPRLQSIVGLHKSHLGQLFFKRSCPGSCLSCVDLIVDTGRVGSHVCLSVSAVQIYGPASLFFLALTRRNFVVASGAEDTGQSDLCQASLSISCVLLHLKHVHAIKLNIMFSPLL